MKYISILHPFTPSAVGIPEQDIPLFHSRPHALAMETLSLSDHQCSMEYLSDHFTPYSVNKDTLVWKFHPVSKRWHADHKKWKKQWSYWATLSYWWKTPDVTIINMSGHSSPFSMYLAKLILRKNKKYVAMLGGQHLTLDERTVEYYHKAAHILVHTRQQKEAMEKLDALQGADIRVFPLGVDCQKYKPIENITTKDSSAPSLLFVGRITELKRIHLAIEALQNLKTNGFPKACLKIVGPSSSQAYFEQLKRMITEKNLDPFVSFEGFIEHDKLVPYYQEADMLLLPSKHEAFGMVMIESMACGTPVAAIDCPGGPKEVVKDGKNGILTTVEEYANAITSAFQNGALITNMKQMARITAVSDYSIEETYSVLKKSVEDCIS